MGKGKKTLTDGEAPFAGIRHLQGLFDDGADDGTRTRTAVGH